MRSEAVLPQKFDLTAARQAVASQYFIYAQAGHLLRKEFLAANSFVMRGCFGRPGRF